MNHRIRDKEEVFVEEGVNQLMITGDLHMILPPYEEFPLMSSNREKSANNFLLKENHTIIQAKRSLVFLKIL